MQYFEMADMRGIVLYYEIKLRKNTGLTETVSFIVVHELIAYQNIYIFKRLPPQTLAKIKENNIALDM